MTHLRVRPLPALVDLVRGGRRRPVPLLPPPLQELLELELPAPVLVYLLEHSGELLVTDWATHVLEHMPQLVLVQGASAVCVNRCPDLSELRRLRLRLLRVRVLERLQ